MKFSKGFYSTSTEFLYSKGSFQLELEAKLILQGSYVPRAFAFSVFSIYSKII